MKSKKGRIALVIVLAIILIALIAVICIRNSNPKYSYKQINEAFFVSEYATSGDRYEDINALRSKESLKQTVQYINLYNDALNEKGKPSENALSLDEVLDFYSSEYDANGEPKIMDLPDKIESYLDWFYGFSKKGPKIENDKFYDIGYITVAMYELGFYSERKNTQQLSDVVIDDPVKFYIDLYAYNEINPTKTITEDEVKSAMVGGPEEPLYWFGDWYSHLGIHDLERFNNRLSDVYFDSYRFDYPDAPIIAEMNLTEIQQLIEYMEALEAN